MIFNTIYSVTPAPYGDNYRVVENFETLEDALGILECLEQVNIDFKLYRLLSFDSLHPGFIYDSWNKI